MLWTRLHNLKCCPELKPEINVFSRAWPRLPLRPLRAARNYHSCAKLFAHGYNVRWNSKNIRNLRSDDHKIDSYIHQYSLLYVFTLCCKRILPHGYFLSVCLSVCRAFRPRSCCHVSVVIRLFFLPYNSRTAERICIKFDIVIMPVEASPNTLFLISYIRNTFVPDTHIFLDGTMIVCDDVISHDPPRWCHRPDVPLHASNSRKTERIIKKCGVNVMPLEATPDSYSLIVYNRKYQNDGCSNFEVWWWSFLIKSWLIVLASISCCFN
jgi:hypothetical protein